MRKKLFTLVELMIGVVLSSIVFVILMSMIMNVTWLVRDLYADQTLNNYSRYCRYVLLNGVGDTRGLASMKNVVDVSDTGYTYKAGSTGVYNFSLTPIAEGDDIRVELPMSSIHNSERKLLFGGESLLVSPVTVVNSSFFKDDSAGDGKVSEFYIKRRVWGKDYVIGNVIKTVGP
jgi:hypothetical protein